MNERKWPSCATCSIRNKACQEEQGSGPDFCPTLHQKEVIEEAIREYQKEEIREFARSASIQEAECYAHRHIKPYNILYPVKSRVQEVCEFAKKMGYQRLGIAFCDGLRSEAKSLSEILRAQGFDVVSAVCKVGCTPKEVLGLEENQKIAIGEFESMCSPISQAAILNEADTDFNILVGLCVGHDSLFLKYSSSFCTVLVAKDRVLGHNPAAALHSTGSYYAKLLKPGIDPNTSEGADLEK